MSCSCEFVKYTSGGSEMLYLCQSTFVSGPIHQTVPRMNKQQGKQFAEQECHEFENELVDVLFGECFSASTVVLMSNGETKRISEVVSGDELLVADDLLGELSPLPVANVEKKTHRARLSIKVSSGATIVTSMRQPFGTTFGPIEAKRLLPGAVLSSADSASRELRNEISVEEFSFLEGDEELYSLIFEQPVYFFVSDSLIATRCKKGPHGKPL